MAVKVEKNGSVWTVIHDRPEARNAMDPASGDALTAAFLEFDADKKASVAVFYGAGGAFCAGWDLKYVSTLNADYPLGELDIPTARPNGNGGDIPRGPLGPSRLELDKPVIAAIEGPRRRRWNGIGPVVRFSRHGERLLLRGLLSTLGRAADRWWDRATASHRRPRSCLGNYFNRPKSACRRMLEYWALRIRDTQRRCARKGRRVGTGDRAFSASLRACRSSLGNQESRADGARGADSGMVQWTGSPDRGRGVGSHTLQRRSRSTWRLREDSIRPRNQRTGRILPATGVFGIERADGGVQYPSLSRRRLTLPSNGHIVS